MPKYIVHVETVILQRVEVTAADIDKAAELAHIEIDCSDTTLDLAYDQYTRAVFLVNEETSEAKNLNYETPPGA